MHVTQRCRVHLTTHLCDSGQQASSEVCMLAAETDGASFLGFIAACLMFDNLTFVV